jgi:hypothetical protein
MVGSRTGAVMQTAFRFQPPTQPTSDAVAAQADTAVSKAPRNEAWTLLGISGSNLLAALVLSCVDEAFANYVPGIGAVVGFRFLLRCHRVCPPCAALGMTCRSSLDRRSGRLFV